MFVCVCVCACVCVVVVVVVGRAGNELLEIMLAKKLCPLAVLATALHSTTAAELDRLNARISALEAKVDEARVAMEEKQFLAALDVKAKADVTQCYNDLTLRGACGSTAAKDLPDRYACKAACMHQFGILVGCDLCHTLE